MNEKGLLDIFIKIQKAYSSVKILDLKRLGTIGTKLGYDYLIFPLMLNDSSYTYGEGGKYTGYGTQIDVNIFDVNQGKIVFQANAKSSSSPMFGGGSLRSAYNDAFTDVLKKLF